MTFLDGVNAMLDVVSAFWSAFINDMPIYGGVTVGYWIIACVILGLVFSAFVYRFKI